jgi:hypothetical protein
MQGTWQTTEGGGGGWIGAAVAIAVVALALRAMVSAATVVGAAVGTMVVVAMWVAGSLVLAAVLAVAGRIWYRRHRPLPIERPAPWRATVESQMPTRQAAPAAPPAAIEAPAPVQVIHHHHWAGVDAETLRAAFGHGHAPTGADPHERT